MLWLSRFAIVLAFVVVVLGAFTRLTEAGLGCPDWPGCYGFLTVPTAEQIDTAHARFPEQPVEHHKAWNEMIHRYFAGTLGLVILALAIGGVRTSQQREEKIFSLAAISTHTSALLLLVIFQAILGMLTVTMDLKPIIVMGHLLGGFSIFVLLVLLERRLVKQKADSGEHSCGVQANKLMLATAAATGLLIIQIALGGWTAANYAALTCTQLPICEGDWQNKLDFAQAFSPTPHAETYQYGVLDYAARMTIHVTHRVGAIIVTLGLFLYCLLLWRAKIFTKQLISINLLLFMQISLGISNVVMSLPLAVAVAHNAVALLLLSSLIITWHKVSLISKVQVQQKQSPQILLPVKELS
ncbi:COX15/CtaA family protein [Catenovulum agarivorans]|uniref:COX15/CtaA family protein n=1 Tax=Catenovulum agarivorans TaxID=1172192 RepID=UPI0003024C0A|nr:COX15/CtaA family protein [Catenovulum agarivorans]